METDESVCSLEAEFNELKVLLLDKFSFDEMSFVGTRLPKEQILVVPINENKERFFISQNNRKSIVTTVSESLLPNIINHTEDSFIYNKESDNPLSFDLGSIVALPCYFQDNAYAFGVVMLYRFKREKDFFKKEEVEVAQDLLLDFLKKQQRLITTLLLKTGISTNKIETAEEKENEVERANQFFSSVIHDIRTPMNAVMGFLELLQDEVTPKQREYLSAAYRSSEMVVALINDVLDINKLSMGKVDIDNHFFSLMDEVENTALLFYHTAVKKEIDFIFYYDPYIPYMIKTDPFRLKQIMNNLLSNAIKFTPKGGMVVMEFIYEEANDTLVFKVIDNGIGISKSAQKNIFQPFTQEGSETSGKYGGTGLGLTISKQLSELLGGGLFLQSEKDVGSEFTIVIPSNAIYGTAASIEVESSEMPMVYFIDGQKSKQRYIKYYAKYFERMGLPYKIVSIDDAVESTDSEGIFLGIKIDYESDLFKELTNGKKEHLIILETDLFSDMRKIPEDIIILEMPVFPKKLFSTIVALHQGILEEEEEQAVPEEMRVLIVDDNLINLKLTQEVIRKFGFTTVSAKDGQEAVEIFKSAEKPFNIILIDQNMPTLSGTEAIKKIRAFENGKDVKIYGLTGYSDEKTNRKMMEAGADDILHKPIKIDRIKEIIGVQ